MAGPTPSTLRGRAAVAAVASAFVWATYYVFVLWLTPGTAPSAVFAWPFVFGGFGYAAWAVAIGHGRWFLTLWGDARAWGRTGLIVAMQLSVLAGTYVAGPVDTSLLSLVGDVALTPVLVMLLFGVGRERASSPGFVVGIVLSTVGASLTIVAGGSVRPLSGAAWVIAPLIPLTVAFYFLATARANLRAPTSAVVGNATLSAGFVGLVLAGALPGGYGGLVAPSPTAWALLVILGLSSFTVSAALYFQAIEWAGLFLPTLLMASIPVFTLGLSWGLFGIAPPLWGLAGIPIAVVGALFALQGSHPPWTPTYPVPHSAPAVDDG